MYVVIKPNPDAEKQFESSVINVIRYFNCFQSFACGSVQDDRDGLGSVVGRVSNPRSGGTRFIVEVINTSTSCFPFGTRVFGTGLGLVAPLSV